LENKNINLFEDQVADLNKPIDIYDKSYDEIRNATQPYLTIDNVGKYLIFRDDNSGSGAQTDTYTAYEIINEDKKNPLVSLSDNAKKVFIMPNVGGRVFKHKKNKSKRNKSKKNKSKKNKKVKSKK
jgi:hypothetical protein